MAIHEPDFDSMLGAIDGYNTSDSRPSRTNLLVFKEKMFESILDPGCGCDEDWDQVLAELYRRLSFWRFYFCGVDASPEVSSGGIQLPPVKSENLTTTSRFKSCRAEIDKRVMKHAMIYAAKSGMLSPQLETPTPDSNA